MNISFTKPVLASKIWIQIILILGLFLFALNTHAQELSTESAPTPPGCVKVNDTLFMDETEVQNAIWQNYLFYLKRDSIELDHDPYTMALPDTSVWINEIGEQFGQQFAKYYHQSPETENHPVVGVTYEQALAFCKWRSAMDTQLFNYQYKLNDEELTDYRSVWVEFHYRLPSEEEWEMACVSNNYSKAGYYGFSNTYGEFPRTKNIKNAIDTNVRSRSLNKDIQNFYSLYPHLLLSNVKPEITPYFIQKRKIPRFTEDVYYYPPNELGLYGMTGNVAEMVQGKGKTKGGCWADPLSRCKYNLTGYFNKASTKVGFRSSCVVKILPSEPKKKFWQPNY